jgi:hypothetical protein
MEPLEKKLSRYRDFWDNKPVNKPLIGFDVGGWFPFQRFSDLKVIADKSYFGPEALDPARCLPDYEILAQESLEVPDDFIKGVSPISAIPWLEAMLGCRLMRNGETVWAEEKKADWSLIKNLAVPNNNSWFRKYIDFVKALTLQTAGRYPVGVPILRGAADLLGALRGHTESILDCLENPIEARRLARLCAEALIRITKAHHKTTSPYQGGYFIEQYSLWAPGPLVRMQEDASALYSPDLYRAILMESDRMVARSFPYSLIHLHSSSLFLIREFLEIREIGVFQINKDVGEMGLPEIIPYLKIIQNAGRRIFLRGPLSAEDFMLIKKELSPGGLMVQSVTGSTDEAWNLSREAARIFG